MISDVHEPWALTIDAEMQRRNEDCFRDGEHLSVMDEILTRNLNENTVIITPFAFTSAREMKVWERYNGIPQKQQERIQLTAYG